MKVLSQQEVDQVSGGDGSLTVLVQVKHVNSNGDTYYVDTWMSPLDAALYRAGQGAIA